MAAHDPIDDVSLDPEECRIRKASGIARKHAAEAMSVVEKLTRSDGEPADDEKSPRQSERVKRDR